MKDLKIFLLGMMLFRLKMGGTGVKDLKVAFQRGINDFQIKILDKNSITLINDVIMLSDFTAMFILNKNSILIKDRISVKKENADKVTIPAITFPFESESIIENIVVANNMRLTVKNGLCTISLYFKQNECKVTYNSNFIPLI